MSHAPRPLNTARFFDAITGTTPDFLYIFDRQGRFQYANPRLLEVWGMKLEDAIGKTCRELGYEQWHHDMHMREIAQVIDTKAPIKGEVPFQAPLTGIFGVYDYIFNPVFDAQGEVELIAGITRDVTDRKLLQEEHRADREKLRLALDAAELGTWTYRFSDHAWELDDRAAQLYNTGGPSVIHDEAMMRRIMHDDDIPLMWERVQKAIDPRGDGRYVIEYRIRQNDGSYRWLAAWARVEFEGEGEARRAVRMTGASRDITARKRAEQDLQAAQAELERHRAQLEHMVEERTAQLQDSSKRLRDSERLASLGTLTAGLGHDLHNSLLPLRVHTQELAQAARRDPSISENVAAIEAMLLYLSSLSRGMQMLSRDPEQPGRDGSTDLQEWCGNAHRVLSSVAGRTIDFSCHVDKGTPRASIADHRLTQAVFNLVQNARDAIIADRGDGPGEISVHAAPAKNAEGWIELRVTDNGPGMDEATRRRCMEPFFTTKARSAPVGEAGTGMGLALVNGIVSGAGGRIEIESARGQGTTFRLFIPAAAAETESAPATKITAELGVSDPRRRAAVTALLRGAGWSVRPASGTPNHDTHLWVTEPDAATPAQVHSFTAHPGRRALILTSDGEAYASDAVTCFDAARSFTDLRRAIEGLTVQIAAATDAAPPPPRPAPPPHN